MVTIRKQFQRIAEFDQWVIGAVDGTYVVIPAPEKDPEVFRTRKCNFAVTLQGICTATLRFISCFAGFPSSVGDRRIFENSPVYKDILRCKTKYFPTQEYIIGDKAYPVYDWCQTPFIRRSPLNEAQELYNTLLSSTRQVIERAFGLLFGRFRRLKFLDMSKAEKIPDTILACCVLHNLCLAEKKYEDFIEEGILLVRENNSLSENDENTVASQSTVNAVVGAKRRGEVAARLHSKRIADRM